MGSCKQISIEKITFKFINHFALVIDFKHIRVLYTNIATEMLMITYNEFLFRHMKKKKVILILQKIYVHIIKEISLIQKCRWNIT